MFMVYDFLKNNLFELDRYMCTKCITMCPRGCHPNGFMATPEFGQESSAFVSNY